MRTKEVMRNSKEQLRRYKREVAMLQEDSNLSWEGMELASGWKGLNKSRRLEKEIKSIIETSWVLRNSLLDHQTKLEELRQNCRQHYSFASAIQAKSSFYRASIDEVVGGCHAAKAAALDAAQRIAGAFSFVKVAGLRSMKYIDAGFVHIRDPIQRCGSQYRGFHSEICRISRCDIYAELVVSVRFDTLTGYFMIESTGDNLFEFEESLFYSDCGLTTTPEPGVKQGYHEVLMSPSDVRNMLLKSSHYRLAWAKEFEDVKMSCSRFLGPYIGGRVGTAGSKSVSLIAKQREDDVYRVGHALIGNIRLHPLSGRLCLGERSLSLRANHLLGVMTRGLSRIPGSFEIARLVYNVMGCPSLTAVSFDGTSFTVKVFQGPNRCTQDVKIHLFQVLTALQSNPHLLSSFLMELTKFSFRPQTIHFILDYYFNTNQDPLRVPSFIFERLEHKLVCSCVMVYAKKYTKVETYAGSGGNLLFQFLPDFSTSCLGAHFTGDSFNLFLSREEIQNFVAKNTSDYGLLDKHRMRELCSFLLNHIHAAPVEVNSSMLWGDRVHAELSSLLLVFGEWASRRLPNADEDYKKVSVRLIEYINKWRLESNYSSVARLCAQIEEDQMLVKVMGAVDTALVPHRKYRALGFHVNNDCSAVVLLSEMRPVDESAMESYERYLMRDQDASSSHFRSIPTEVTRTRHFSKSETLVDNKPLLCGVFFPVDETREVVFLQSRHIDLRSFSAELLQRSGASLKRILSQLFVEYTTQSSDATQVNQRYIAYIMHHGGKVEDSSGIGDRVCLFRNQGLAHLKFQEWIESHHNQRENDEKFRRNLILESHERYLCFLYTHAAFFAPSFMYLLGHSFSLSEPLVASVDETRLLIQRCLSSIADDWTKVKQIVFDPFESISSLNEYFFYEELSPDVVFLPRQLAVMKAHYSAHIVAAMYERHVSSCSLPLSYCNLPRCAHIRQSLSEKNAFRTSRDERLKSILAYFASPQCVRDLLPIAASEKAGHVFSEMGLENPVVAMPMQSTAHDGQKFNPEYSAQDTSFSNTSMPCSRQAAVKDVIPSHIINAMFSMEDDGDNEWTADNLANIGPTEYTLVGDLNAADEIKKLLWIASRLHPLKTENFDGAYGFDMTLEEEVELPLADGTMILLQVLFGVLHDSCSWHSKGILPTALLSTIGRGLRIVLKTPDGGFQTTFSFLEGNEMKALLHLLEISPEASFNLAAAEIIELAPTLFLAVRSSGAVVGMTMERKKPREKRIQAKLTARGQRVAMISSKSALEHLLQL